LELLICFDLVIKVVGEVKPYAGDEAKRKIDAASLNSAMVACSAVMASDESVKREKVVAKLKVK
jgi:hypothetical protein